MESEENKIIVEDNSTDNTVEEKIEASKPSEVTQTTNSLADREAALAAREAQLFQNQTAMAEMMRQMSEKMSKVDSFLKKADEQMDLIDGKKFDTTKPRPLTQKSLLAYINWLKIYKPAVYEKKKAELEMKLSKLTQ